MGRGPPPRHERVDCHVCIGAFCFIVFILKSTLIFRSSFDTTARLWDSVTGQCIYVFQDHLRPLYALKLSDDGKFMATGGADGWLHIYHIRVREVAICRLNHHLLTIYRHKREFSRGFPMQRDQVSSNWIGSNMKESIESQWHLNASKWRYWM